MVVHPDWEENEHIADCISQALSEALTSYNHLVALGMPVYEARQVLPNACAVNFLWTINARSLVNFLQQRLCRRNVCEMVTLASKVFEEVELWWPDIANQVGPYCNPKGKCNQGKMTCGRPYVPPTASVASNREERPSI